MELGYKIVNAKQLKELLTSFPMVVQTESEIVFSPAQVGQVIILVQFAKDSKSTKLRNGYEIYYVTDTNIVEAGFPQEYLENIPKIEMRSGLYAYKLPQVDIVYDEFKGGYNVITGNYLDQEYSTVLRTEDISTDIKDTNPKKIPSSAIMNIINTKLETILNLMCKDTFINEEGILIGDTNIFRRTTILQSSFKVGESEIVIPRKNLLNDPNITKCKIAKAYITSDIKDGIYPNLICVVTDEAVKVKAIVNNRVYKVTSEFTINIEISYDFKQKLD